MVTLDMALPAQPGPLAVVEALGEAAILGAVARGSGGSWSKTSPPRSILGGGGEEVAVGGQQKGVSVPPFLFCCFFLCALRGGCGCHPLLQLRAPGQRLL